MAKGTLYVIAAPSGAGKTSLVKAVIEEDPNVAVSISHTTRAPRPGEMNGVHYHFIDEASFSAMVKKELFLEHAMVFGYHYGTSKEYVLQTLERGHDVILEIDWQGAEQVAKIIPCVSIFILPPSMEVLKDRLYARRQDSQSVIEKRLSEAATEVSHCVNFDYIVVNKDFSRAKSDLLSIFRANRLLKKTQLIRHKDLISKMTDN